MLPKDLAKGRSWEPWKIFPKIMISEFFSKVQGLLGGTNGDNAGEWGSLQGYGRVENPHVPMIRMYEEIESCFPDLTSDEIDKILAALPSAYYGAEKKDLLLLARKKRGLVFDENQKLSRLLSDCSLDVTIDQLDCLITVVDLAQRGGKPLGTMIRTILHGGTEESRGPQGGVPVGGFAARRVGDRV